MSRPTRLDPRTSTHTILSVAFASSLAFAGQADRAPAGKPVDLPPGASADWWSEVSRQIQLEEYEIFRRFDGTPVAPNPAHRFETAFADGSFRVKPLDGSFTWGLTLVRWGRPGALEEVAPVPPVPERARVEYRRERFTEWLQNSPEGLEHGFTIPAPPRGAGGRLVLDLRLEGGLRPVFADDGAAVDFFTSGSVSVLRYAKLLVTDARGVSLPARLCGVPGGIRISMEDGGAVYPISVDPLATSAAWAGSGDENGAYYGISVGTAGDVNGDGYSDVIVGAYAHDAGAGASANRGRAYVYLGSASGLLTSAAWTVSGDEDGAQLGYSVSTAGDVNGDGYSDAMVAAEGHDAGAGTDANRGRVYVYLGSASGLSTTAAWTVSGDENSGTFLGMGYCVGTAGDVNGDGYSDAIVGVREHNAGAGSNANRGRAYVYLGSASGLSTSAAWTVSGDEDLAYLGVSVCTAGDVNGDGYADAIVGAEGHNAGGANRGRAYVYLGSASGLSTSAAWTVSGDEDSTQFGISVSTAGDVNGDGYADAIVGADYHDAGAGAGANRGRAYVYLGSASGLSTTAAWTGSGDENSALFGHSVSTAGDVNGDGYSDAIVGASQHDAGAGAGANRGRAYVYLGSASGLSATAAWTGSGDENSAAFGHSVSTAGDVNGDGYSDVVVGAYRHDAGAGAGADRGRAYLYLGSAAGLQVAASWAGSGDESNAYLGIAVSAAGDVNGDGYSDVVVGAYGHDAGAGAGANRGRAYLYLGSAAGLQATAAWTGSGDENEAWYGASVAAGDVNGDGYADVVVGAYGHDAGGGAFADRGRVYLHLGSAVGLQAAASWTASGDENGAWLGVDVGAAGDVNGDGHADVVVGAYLHDGGVAGSDRGRAYLHLGSAAGLLTSASWTDSGDESRAFYGYSVGTAGDVNGDGYSDVVVGANGHDAGAGAGADRGRAYVYLGSAAGLEASAAWIGSGDENAARYGISAGSASDVNGDGYSDVVVGAYGHDAGAGAGADRGRAYVYLGSAAGLQTLPAWTGAGDENRSYYGISVGTAGDVNGDGYPEVVVGAYLHDAGAGAGANRGRAYLYLGSAAGLPAAASWVGSGDENDASYGQSVGAAGDVNGDGYGEVVVGAPWHDGGGGAFANRGRVYLHLGNDGGGVTLRPRQLRSDLSAPIVPLGLAHEMKLRLGLRLRTPFGRGMVRFQWQAIPLGESFNTVWHPVQSGPLWWDSKVVPIDRNELLNLASVPGPFIWRARVKYGIATCPLQPHGPWVTLAANGLHETDLRGVLSPPPPPCIVPDEPLFIASVTLNGQNMPVLHIQDPNQPSSVTGYNIYRATAPAGPFGLVASDIVDMDAGTPNVQWVDQNGAVGGPYYYQVRAYNHDCPAEGP